MADKAASRDRGAFRRRARQTLIVAIIGAGVLVLPDLAISVFRNGPSICHGQPQAGWIENAVRVKGGASVGRPYCWVCTRLLRTHGHEKAVAAIAAAYDDVGAVHPGTDWVYGETGWPWGGRFWPHRTHRNGLSFDFMVPLAGGARLPTHPFNLFGYGLDFDSEGRSAAGAIDFAAIASHLRALDEQARARGGRIGRVIFAPDLQDDLFRSPGAAGLSSQFKFSTRPSWFRHDQHFHVDFEFPCRPT